MSTNCTDTVPYAREYLSNLTDVGFGIIISTAISTLFTLIISCVTFWRIYINTENLPQRYICWLLVGLCPIVAVTSFAGLLSPRSSQMNFLLSSIYLSVTIVLFFRLIMLYMGGEKALCEKLKGVRIPLNKRPCCCCICLRNVYLTRKNLQRVKLMVYQSVIIRPLLLYMATMSQIETQASSSSPIGNIGKSVLSVLTIISTSTSLIGLVAMFRLSKKALKYHGIVLKFLHMKVVLICFDLQRGVLSFIAARGALPCSHIFYHPDKASTLTFILLCYEMVLLSILGFKQYGRKTPESINIELDIPEKGDKSSGYNSMDDNVTYKERNPESYYNFSNI